MKKWLRIILVLLGLTALFMTYQNFSDSDFAEFQKIEKDKNRPLRATSPEGLAEELILRNMPGYQDFEDSLNRRINGRVSYTGGSNKYETEVALIGSGSSSDARWKASLINTNSVKMTYEDFEVTCNNTGDVNLNKKINDKTDIEFSRRPSSNSQHMMLKYSW